MTVLVLVAFPDPHSELQEPQELHEDTWQSITGAKIKIREGTVLDGERAVSVNFECEIVFISSTNQS